MAHVAITVEDFTTRFPKYADEDTDFLDAILVEVLARVDDSWLEQDYRTAQLYYMAHLVSMQGVTDDGDPSVGMGGKIASESFGPMSRSYVTGPESNSDGDGDLLSTGYGRQFAEIRRRNFPGIAVA